MNIRLGWQTVFISVGACIVLVVFAFQLLANSNGISPIATSERGVVTFENATISVEIADTAFTRMRGLSGHAPLLADEGMLFIFDEPGVYGFWMKDMLFPIDIIWLDANRNVVHIKSNADPSSYPESFAPEMPAQFVLEVTAGYTNANGIEIGSVATITLPDGLILP